MSQKKNSAQGNFENDLLGVHTKALQDNSESIVSILEVLAENKEELSESETKQIERIKKSLGVIDRRLDKVCASTEKVSKKEEKDLDIIEIEDCI